jgi:hypothetical protein
MNLSLAAASLPWLGLPDAAAIDAALLPETRVARVRQLALVPDASARFCASDIRMLPRWLALFLGLQRVSFAHGTVEKIPAAERARLAYAICVACQGINQTRDVVFNVFDD